MNKRKKDRSIRQNKIKIAGTVGSVKLRDMKLKDLKRAAVAYGMPFEEVVSSGVPQLESFYIRAYNGGKKIRVELLDEFDTWHENHLRTECGLSEEFLHPQLRLGYVTEKDEDTGEVKRRRIKGYRKTRKKREKNEFGIFTGTKKALTFKCAKDGMNKKDAIAKVMEVFPDAKEKSIGIWFNKALKSQ